MRYEREILEFFHIGAALIGAGVALLLGALWRSEAKPRALARRGRAR
jgi:hypothetical protein